MKNEKKFDEKIEKKIITKNGIKAWKQI